MKRLALGKKARLASILCALFMMCSMAISVSARNVADYNLTMPRLGGKIYTSSLKKTGTTKAVNNNTSIGGGYTMHCAIYKASDSSKMSSTKSCGSGDRILIPYNDASSAKGVNVKMGAWTSLTTGVKVQTSGSWSPDES